MASKPTVRSLQTLISSARRPCEFSTPFQASSRIPSSLSFSSNIRPFSTTASLKETQFETEQSQRPRWSYTPERMRAPFSLKLKDTTKPWECNSDPRLLDDFYIRFLGRGGETVLTEEVKWLAITHKSFDQGRRGFNDRLAFLGMCALCDWIHNVVQYNVYPNMSTNRRFLQVDGF